MYMPGCPGAEGHWQMLSQTALPPKCSGNLAGSQEELKAYHPTFLSPCVTFFSVSVYDYITVSLFFPRMRKLLICHCEQLKKIK